MLKIEIDRKKSAEVFEKLVLKRFNGVESINRHLENELDFNPNLRENPHDDMEKEDGYDFIATSNCTVADRDLCYLDVYYLNTNEDGRIMVTEVGYDFNT